MQMLLALGDDLSTEGMCILLDIQKAFDTIGWNFIRSVLIEYQMNLFVGSTYSTLTRNCMY